MSIGPICIFPPTHKRVAQTLAKCFPKKERNALGSYREIGRSRGGLPIYGVEMLQKKGALPLRKRLRISVTAGAHADEPAGPLAALTLVHKLLCGIPEDILRETVWRICPHVNPDGAAANAAWMDDGEIAPDFLRYAQHAVRDQPGDDVEFLYPMEAPPAGAVAPRPENIAVANFLREGGPYDLHLSLHGMMAAEGGWCLVGGKYPCAQEVLLRSLAGIYQDCDLGMHDIDRNGEKGFHRLAPGFATTPTGAAMREFFEKQGDAATAGKFLNSSMEFVQSLGRDPLLIVSELPLFRLHGGGKLTNPPGPDTPLLRFRPKFKEARAQFLQSGDPAPLLALREEFDLRPVGWEEQIRGILGFVSIAAFSCLQAASD